MWGDVGVTGEWATKPISLYGRNSISGTYEFFKQTVLYGGDFKESVKQQPGSEAVVENVANDKFAIGYSGLGYKSRPSAGWIPRPQSISMNSRGATGHEPIALGASNPAPCFCASTTASGTPSPSLQRAMSGARRLMPASPASRERSPVRPGTARAFLVSGSTRGPRFHRMQPTRRRERPTGDNLPGIQEPGHGRPHNVRATNPLPFPFTAGSADHVAALAILGGRANERQRCNRND